MLVLRVGQVPGAWDRDCRDCTLLSLSGWILLCWRRTRHRHVPNCAVDGVELLSRGPAASDLAGAASDLAGGASDLAEDEQGLVQDSEQHLCHAKMRSGRE